MNRVCSLALCLIALLALAADEPKSPRTDLYGDPLPPGAVMRLGTIRLRHAGAEVAFSKDGKQLISCGRDGEVRFWDVATGKLVRRQQLTGKPRVFEQDANPNEMGKADVRNRLAQKEEAKRFSFVVLSPSSETVAGWMEQELYLGDTSTSKERGVLSFDSFGNWMGPWFSPDGKFLAVQVPSIDDKSTVQIWDAGVVKKCQTLTIPIGMSLTSAAFSWDGKQLAGNVQKGNDSLVENGIRFDLYLWDTATGKLLHKKEHFCPREQFPRGQFDLWDKDPLIFSPDGKTIAVGGYAEGVRFLDAATLKQKSLLKPTAGIQLDRFPDLAFSPDGRRLASAYCGSVGSENGILIWDLVEAKETRHLPAQYETRLAFAPDGKTLASHDRWSSEIALWDAASVRRLHSRPGHSRGMTLWASPDGKIVSSDHFQGVRLWEPTTGKQLRLLEERGSVINFCLFPSDGKWLVSIGQMTPLNKRTVFNIWDVSSGKKRRRFEFKEEPSQMYSAAISADGERLSTVAGVGAKQTKQLIVWDLATGEMLSRRPYKEEKYDEVVPVSVPYKSIQHVSSIAHAVFTPNGESVVVWLGDHLGMEEVATGCQMATYPKGLGAPLNFSPDGRLLRATVWQTGKDGRRKRNGMSLIETASGEEVVRLKLEGDADFTPDCRGLVVADAEHLCVWDTSTGERLHQMAWPEGIVDKREGETYVCSLAALPSGRVATGMMEGDILVWDLQASTWSNRKPKRELDRKELELLWSDLARDAGKAYPAMHTLTASPTQTVAFFQEHLRAADGKRIEKLLADLDSDSFEMREKASLELKRSPYRAEPMLRQALENKPSLEMRRRIEPILTQPRLPQAEDLRNLRAIAVLERIGTPEARRILEKLAAGALSPETREAQTALQRLQRRDASVNGRITP